MTIHLPTTDLRPHHVPVDGGRIIRHLGSQMRFLETTETTAGQFWLAEQTSERGVASPVHRHTHEDETFVVLDGELEVGVGDESIVLGEREVRFAPRGLPHTFRVVSPQAPSSSSALRPASRTGSSRPPTTRTAPRTRRRTSAGSSAPSRNTMSSSSPPRPA